MRHDQDRWIEDMRIAIMGSSISIQAWDQMKLGLGAPDATDMRGFFEEAAAIADLWEESLRQEGTQNG